MRGKVSNAMQNNRRIIQKKERNSQHDAHIWQRAVYLESFHYETRSLLLPRLKLWELLGGATGGCSGGFGGGGADPSLRVPGGPDWAGAFAFGRLALSDRVCVGTSAASSSRALLASRLLLVPVS